MNFIINLTSLAAIVVKRLNIVDTDFRAFVLSNLTSMCNEWWKMNAFILGFVTLQVPPKVQGLAHLLRVFMISRLFNISVVRKNRPQISCQVHCWPSFLWWDSWLRIIDRSLLSVNNYSTNNYLVVVKRVINLFDINPIILFIFPKSEGPDKVENLKFGIVFLIFDQFIWFLSAILVVTTKSQN